MHKWPDEVRELVRLSLQEDIGKGDITTNAIYSGDQRGQASLITRQDGIVAGLDLAKYVLQQVSAEVQFTVKLNDGDRMVNGSEIAWLDGPLAPVLSAERTMLNFIQRMSGIATQTRLFVERLEGTHCRILDTRKTAPGHRYLDKMAVRLGGGTNHRFRLDDRFLIKENHIRMAGSIPNAINRCLDYRKQHRLDAAIEIEVTNLEELDIVMAVGQVDYVMLDNMSYEDMSIAADRVKSAAEQMGNSCFTEASGNVTLETVAYVAATGVDFVSSGALTHSVRAMDISLLLVNK